MPPKGELGHADLVPVAVQSRLFSCLPLNQNQGWTLRLVQHSNPYSPSAGTAPTPEQRSRHMRSVRSVYRGYAIYVSGGNSSWSFRAEPITADLPILTRAVFEGHASRGTALRTAKRQIDHLVSG